MNSKLITNAAQLMRHIPNVIAAVKGEAPLLDKLTVFLNLAEQWVIDTFVSEKTFNSICKYTEENPIRQATARLVVAETMLRAIPSLDLVLTPNCFAVVNTSNLAPASKPRIDRLIGSMLTHRDDCIAALLPQLHGASQWLASAQADFFGSTLFPDFSVVKALGSRPSTISSDWARYLELRAQIQDIETALANEYLSPELMEMLRLHNLIRNYTIEEQTLIKHIQTEIIAMLKGNALNRTHMADIVNYIRLRPECFPEWHNSPTAQLFAPPVFRNDKKSAGYFFN